MEHRIITSAEDFGTLAGHWKRLAAAGGVRTPYQSFAWLEQWLRSRLREVEPFVILLHDGETIAPLARSGRTGLRQLGMLGTPDSDYVDLITTRPIDDAWDGVAQVLADRRRTFDVVHLQSVRERDAIVSSLRRHLRGLGRERAYERCPWIPTDRSWEELRKSRGKGLQSELKRWGRRIREMGELKVARVRPPLANELVDELESVERRSWKWEQGDSAFRPGPQRQFLQALLRDPRADDAVVWLMRVSGRLVAYALVLIGRDRWYYYLPSFRRDVPNAGSLLLAEIVAAACGDGCAVVDLLRGDHGYKRMWTDRADTVYEIVWPSSLLGQVAALTYATRWRVARSKHLRDLRARLWRVGDRRQRTHLEKEAQLVVEQVASIGNAGRGPEPR